MQRFIRTFDPRLKIALGLMLAVLIWVAGPVGVAAYALGLTAMLVAARLGPSFSLAFKSYLLFLSIWTGLKILVGAIADLPLEQNLAEAGFLAMRLYTLLATGLILSASSSPRSLGLAVSWYLRPLGRWTWQPALALALMIHFLPLIGQTFAQIRQVIGLRCPGLPAHSRLILLLQASLRALAQKTWDQTLALAGRGLDAPEAWQARMPWVAKDLAAGFALATILVVLATF
ncbi:MAG: ABC transporter [Desulfocurvibacter africanus]